MTELELGEIPSNIDLWVGEDISTLEFSPTFFHGLPGILRYKRESQENVTNSVGVEPQVVSDSPVCCEFCGFRVRPPLWPVFTENPEDFCCSQYQELFETVALERRRALQGGDEACGRSTQPKDSLTEQEMGGGEGAREREREGCRAQHRGQERYCKDAHPALSQLRAHTYPSKTVHFQLSRSRPTEDGVSAQENVGGDEGCDSLEEDANSEPSSGFGMTLKDGVHLMEKYYPNGNKFLTVFPDGSAQLFYPSGGLGLTIFTCRGERVCIVQDDQTPHCPIRALFCSIGRTTCYHGNGTIWLSMDKWGGQCLDEGGARTRRWSWGDQAHTPTPLRPIFMSLNRSMGVRVLGQERVFVTFLAMGQQARFSVGACTQAKQVANPSSGPPISKEELFLWAGRVRLHACLLRLQWCCRFPSSQRALGCGPPPFLLSLARKLLSLSHRVPLEEHERTFIQSCLQDVLPQ